MSVREVVLAARMKFDGSQAISSMTRTHAAFQAMAASTQMMKQGFQELTGGLQSMALVGLGAAGGAAIATKKYADFADQMAAVRSVFLGKLPESQFKQMSGLAERLGATTRFTATQAASAMENLARAGMSPIEVMRAVKPVLAAAAAENMNLASAADIVASNLRAFQLPASQAARVADTLAFVSAKTNTNMLQLQEGLKFTASTAKFANIPLTDTAAALGILADVGLKGSIGGTALKNAIIKLSQNMKNGKVNVGKFSVAIAKNKQGGLDLAETFKHVAHTMGRIPEPLDRVKAAIKLFGIRGANAAAGFQALVMNADKAAKLGKKSKLDVLFKGMDKSAKGAAQTMRNLRLNTIKGDFILMGSAIDGVAQAFGQALAPSIRRTVGMMGQGGMTGKLSQAATAFQFFAAQPEALWTNGVPQIKGVSNSITGMVQGLLLGLSDTKQAFKIVGGSIKKTMQYFGLFRDDTTSGSTRMMTGILGIAAAMGVMGAGLKVATSLFGGLARAAIGATRITLGAVKFLTKGVGGLVGGLASKLGLVGRALPGSLRALSGAVSAVEQVTAQPVRVVNLHELALANAAGSAAGGAAGGALTGLAALGASATALALRIPVFGASIAAVFAGPVFTAGLAGLAVGLGKVALVIGTVGLAAYGLTRIIDRVTGLSSGIANLALRLTGHNQRMAQAQEATRNRISFGSARDIVDNMLRVADHAKRNKTMATMAFRADPNQRFRVTRELAQRRVEALLARRGIDKGSVQGMQIMQQISDKLEKLPTAADLNISVQVSGREIARATALENQESRKRGASGNSKRLAHVGVLPGNNKS